MYVAYLKHPLLDTFQAGIMSDKLHDMLKSAHALNFKCLYLRLGSFTGSPNPVQLTFQHRTLHILEQNHEIFESYVRG